MADIGYAYALTYDEDVALIINEPYASKLENLFDGSKVRAQIDTQLTRKTTGIDGLFNPQFVQDFFTNSSNWFLIAAQQNNVHNWAPKTAVRLVHCEGDDVIPYAIANLTQKTMKKMGASDVELVPVEKTMHLSTLVTHSNCGSLAYGIAGNIFAQIRKKTVGY
jgi:hypothetical protein